MVQILNKNPKSLSESFGEGLERFGQAKLKQLEARNQHQTASQRLQALGLGQAESDYLATLPPKEQSALLQSYSQGNQPQPQQQLPYDPNDPRAMAQFHLDRALKQQQGQELEPMGTGLGSQPPVQGPQAPMQQMAPQQQPPTFLQAIGRGSPSAPGGALAPQKQNQIDTANRPWLNKFQKSYDLANQTTDILDQMDDLLKTGKVFSGAKGRFTPTQLQNDETQLFDKLSNQLAAMLAGQSGVATNFKIKFAQTQKPNIEQNPGTQRKLIENLRKEAAKVLRANDIKDQLIAENNYNQPANLETKVNQGLKELGKTPRELPRQLQQEAAIAPQQQSQQSQEESTLEGLGRGAARTLARAGESIVGLPGDILSAGLGVGNYLTGGAIPKYSDIQESVSKLPSWVPNFLLPTSEDLKGKTGEATGGYTNPQGSGEQFYDDIISDVATMAIPLGGKIPFKKQILGALGRATAGNVSSFLTKELGGGELAQAGAKLGTMVLAGTYGGQKALKGEMAKAYTKADELAKNIRGNAGQLEKTVEKELIKLDRGINTPAKKEAADILKSLESRISIGKLSAEDALQSRKDLNDLIFNYNIDKSVKPVFKDVRNELNHFLNSVGETHPTFIKNLKKGDDIYKGFAAKEALGDFISSNPWVNKVLKSTIAKSLFLPAAGYGAYTAPGATALATGSLYGGYKAFQNVAFLTKSKEAQQYYKNAVDAALKNDAKSFARNAAKLDKAALKFEEENQ